MVDLQENGSLIFREVFHFYQGALFFLDLVKGFKGPHRPVKVAETSQATESDWAIATTGSHLVESGQAFNRLRYVQMLVRWVLI